MSEDPQDFSLRKIAIAAFGPSLLFGIGEGAIFPVVALSARDVGASTAWAGFIVALIGLGALVANIPAAALTTRFGERRAMVGAAAFSLLGLALCLLAAEPILLGVGILMVGMASAVFLLARQTWLIEAVPIPLRARAMSTLGGTMRIGLFVGPFIAALFIQLLGLRGAYWAAMLAVLAAGLLSLLIPDLPGSQQKRGAASSPRMGELLGLHARVLLTLGIACSLVSALRACRQIVIPLWADQIGLDATDTALIYGLMGGVDMLLFYPAGMIMDKRGRLWIALPSLLIMASSLMVMPLSTGFASLLLISLVLGLGNGIGSGIVMTIGADASPSKGRTHFLGAWRTISDLGGGTGPLLLSAITALASLAWGILTIGAIGYVAAWMFWHWLPHARSTTAIRS
ncbi:MFS transporter [Castellaniella sp.]|uniref:MFS transporter n=1 Tax=Castellaniella sp. TaxID=1955812 RepID=UPI00355D874E